MEWREPLNSQILKPSTSYKGRPKTVAFNVHLSNPRTHLLSLVAIAFCVCYCRRPGHMKRLGTSIIAHFMLYYEIHVYVSGAKRKAGCQHMGSLCLINGRMQCGTMTPRLVILSVLTLWEAGKGKRRKHLQRSVPSHTHKSKVRTRTPQRLSCSAQQAQAGRNRYIPGKLSSVAHGGSWRPG